MLKNLPKLLDRPKELQERIFKKLFEQAEIAMLDDKEYSDYEESLHNLWDITNAMNDAELKGYGKGKEAGIAEGRADAMREMARALKAIGKMTIEEIATATGLSSDEISKI